MQRHHSLEPALGTFAVELEETAPKKRQHFWLFQLLICVLLFFIQLLSNHLFSVLGHLLNNSLHQRLCDLKRVVEVVSVNRYRSLSLGGNLLVSAGINLLLMIISSGLKLVKIFLRVLERNIHLLIQPCVKVV